MKRYAMVLISLAVAGCGSDRGRGIVDTDIAYKAPAIKGAVSAKDSSALPQLVKDLDDEDPAVRFYAIQGLQRLTGETFGYAYFAEPAAREPAVKQWRAYVEGKKSK